METLAISPRTPLGNLGKWLLNNKDAQIDNRFVYDLIGKNKPAKVYSNLVQEHISDLERHDEILVEACKRAIGELIIVSPFLSINAISNKLRVELKSAVRRGVVITVYCDAKLDCDKSGKRRENSKKALSLLKDMNIFIKIIDGIHSKSMIFETARGCVLIEGSFNWLSAVRDINSDYSRYEASILLVGEALKPRIGATKKLLEQRSREVK